MTTKTTTSGTKRRVRSSLKKKTQKKSAESLNLPKGRLSWSQFNLWRSSKDGYRKQYYYGIDRAPSREMIFGDVVARLLESGARGPIIDRIPRLPVSEHKIEAELEGVPMLAFIDSFLPITGKMFEFKTGHADRHGKAPWDTVKVRKHDQLPLYMALIEKQLGFYDPQCALIWIETEKEKVMEDFGSFEMETQGKLRLTGRIEVFQRRIAKWELRRIAQEVRRVAEEISEDFTRFEKEML